jgi:hypothetical protein
VAAKVTLSPVVGVVVDAASVVVVFVRLDDGLIESVTAPDVLAEYVFEPPYAAVTRCCPVVQKIVDWVAVPELRVAVPSEAEVVVSVNVTVPVAAEGETVAVKVTLSPVVSVPVVEDVSAVAVDVRVADALTVRETALEVLAA